MSRTIIAFLVAPLWVPILTVLFARLVMFPQPEQGHWVALATIVSAVFSYGGVLLLGLPLFLILRSRKLTAFWIAIVLGFVIGALTYFVFAFLFSFSLGTSTPDAAATVLSINWAYLIYAGIAGSIGSFVGATLWLIARPDRN